MSRYLLDEILMHNYENYQVLFNKLKFHNHNAHHLGSLFFLGANDQLILRVYKIMCNVYDPYDPSPHQITKENWRKFLGDKRFCKAYRNFFEQELMNSKDDDWRNRFWELLLEDDKEPMINAMIICNMAHPLIHIGYAFELDRRIILIEALTQTAVCYNPLHESIDKLKPPQSPSKSALEIFEDIHSNNQFQTFPALIAVRNLLPVVEKSSDILQSHYDQWNINEDNLEKSIEELFDLCIYVFSCTHKSDKIEFDFFILHLVTSMHAIRVIYPYLKAKQLLKNVLSHFLYFASIVYIASNRPKIDIKLIDDYKVDQNKMNWNYVIQQIFNSNLANFRHVPKLVHSLKSAEKDYGFKNGLYLKIAVKTIDNIDRKDGWVSQTDNPYYFSSLKQT